MRPLIAQRKFEVFRLPTRPGHSHDPPWAQVATATSEVAVVMSGLDNPRGPAFGPEGALYVAEAGRGPPCPLTNPTQQQCTCAEALCSNGLSGPTGA